MKFLAMLGVGLFIFSAAQADDCQFIRDEIRQAPATGAEIYIPPGRYVCAAPVVVDKDHITLRGAGQRRSVLVLQDHVHAPLLIIGNDKTVQDSAGNYIPLHRVADIEVKDLTLDGNRENHDVAKECGEESCEGNPHAVRNNGLTIRGASRVKIERVTTKSMISGGVVTEKYCDRLLINDLTSFDNYFDGFAGYETTDSVFMNMHLHHNLGAGLSLDINFNDNLIRDSRLSDNKDVGVFMRHSNRNRFVNLDILYSGNHGVFLAQSGAPRSCAEDNDFDTVTVNHSARSAFRLNDACRGNHIRGLSDLCHNKEVSVSESFPGLLAVAPTTRCGP